MEAAISEQHLKTFVHTLQCLGKIGRELYIEADHEKMTLRSLNDAKSAFAAFYLYKNSFFDSFRLVANSSTGSSAGGGSAEDEDSFRCKLPVKALQGVLKSLKKVVMVRIYSETSDDRVDHRLVFEMQHDSGVKRKHKLTIQDCDLIHAVFDQNSASRLACQPLQLSQLLHHIHGTAEVAVLASPEQFYVRSYHPSDHPAKGKLNTEMKVAATEFDLYEYHAPRDVEMVFCIKEAKALLAFCEATDVDSLVLYFYSGGRPIMFTCDAGASSGEVVLATMEPRGLDLASQSEYTYEPSLSNGHAAASQRTSTIQNTQTSRSSGSHVLHDPVDPDEEDNSRLRTSALSATGDQLPASSTGSGHDVEEPAKRSRVDPRARLFDSDDSESG